MESNSQEAENNDEQMANGDQPAEDGAQSHGGDDSNPGKIFIGGLAKSTTPLQFTKYFSKYGEITDSVIMKDRRTGDPRGFGFVTYADPSVVDKVMQDSHTINGKQVEIKRTIPRGSTETKDFKTKKVFVGGIPTATTQEEFKDFFAKFGDIKEHEIIRDHSNNRSRGFGFVTFESEETVDELLSKGNKIDFAGTQVEIKKAEPKKPQKPPPSRYYGESKAIHGGGFGEAFAGGYGGGSYRSGPPYSGRQGGYAGYGANDFGVGYKGPAMGAYRGEPSLGYSSRYGGSFGRGYYGGGYGGPADGYGGFAPPAASYGGGFDTEVGGGYGMGAGPYYGGRGTYGAGSRYHPYAR